MVGASDHWLSVCFTSTETVGFLGTGAQDDHLNFHIVPELLGDHDDDDKVELHVLGCRLTYQGQIVTNAEARFSVALRPQKP